MIDKYTKHAKMEKHMLDFLNNRTHCFYVCIHHETASQVNKLYYYILYHHKLTSFEYATTRANKRLEGIFKQTDFGRRLPLLAYCIYECVKGAYGFRENNIFVENPELTYYFIKNKYTVELCHSDKIIELIKRVIHKQLDFENEQGYYNPKVSINFEAIEKVLGQLKNHYYEKLRNRIKPIKEELISKAWSTERIEKWLSAGFTVEEISEF